jgi:hypothetical protein
VDIGIGSSTRAPITAMPRIIGASKGQAAGSAIAPQYLNVYRKTKIFVEYLQQGFQPRLCRVSVVTSHLQDVMVIALIVDDHLQVRFALCLMYAIKHIE